MQPAGTYVYVSRFDNAVIEYVYMIRSGSMDRRIGGKGVKVLIDEAKLGKRKYNRGHRVNMVWIFRGIELLQLARCR